MRCKIIKRTDIEIFTIEEYFKYKSIKAYNQGLSDNSQGYKYDIKNINNAHDKTYRKILDDKEEAVELINKALKLDKEKNKLHYLDIEKYNSRFVTNDLKNSEADVIYKYKNRNIFFLIEHQSKIDYSMPYRILMYCIEIMKSAVNEKLLLTKAYKFPVIYPIVLYTGKRKWNVEQYIEQKQEKLEQCEQNSFSKYNIIDINEYKKEELLDDETFLSKMCLLSKTNTVQELENNLHEILKKDISEKNMQLLINIVKNAVLSSANPEEKIRVNEILEKKEEDEDMEQLVKSLIMERDKTLKEELEKGIQEGKKEGKYELLQAMIGKVSDGKIIEITKITQEELENIKKKLNSK